MTIKVRFRRANPDYNQEYADFHNNGKECMQNPKFDWVWESKAQNIESLVLEPQQIHPVTFLDSDGNEKDFVFQNMCVLNCYEEKTGRMHTWAISRSALLVMPERRPLRNFTNHEKGTVTQYFDIKPDSQLVEVGPGLYVAQEELPNELK
jgi:hypothetical protein